MSCKGVKRIWESGLAAHEKRVMAPMAWFANDDGTSCHPSMRRIALMSSVTERSVRRTVSAMKEMGVLVVTKPSKGRRSTTYKFRFDRLPTWINPDTDDMVNRDTGVIVEPSNPDTHVRQP